MRAVHQHQLDAQAVQQGDVVEEAIEVLAQGGFTAKSDDEHPAVVGVGVGGGGAQGGDEGLRVHRQSIGPTGGRTRSGLLPEEPALTVKLRRSGDG
jgi:hypothetical protein